MYLFEGGLLFDFLVRSPDTHPIHMNVVLLLLLRSLLSKIDELELFCVFLWRTVSIETVLSECEAAHRVLLLESTLIGGLPFLNSFVEAAETVGLLHRKFVGHRCRGHLGAWQN